MDFKDMLGDDTLEIEKERELIELMYKERQTYTPLPYVFGQSYMFPENEPDAENAARLEKEKNENMRKTFDAYVESAEGILSEPQMEIFEWILNANKSSFINDNENIHSSDKEKGEE